MLFLQPDHADLPVLVPSPGTLMVVEVFFLSIFFIPDIGAVWMNYVLILGSVCGFFFTAIANKPRDVRTGIEGLTEQNQKKLIKAVLGISFHDNA